MGMALLPGSTPCQLFSALNEKLRDKVIDRFDVTLPNSLCLVVHPNFVPRPNTNSFSINNFVDSNVGVVG